MAIGEKRKDRMRRWIRVTMVFVAIVLLVFSMVIPFINNAVALGVENQLKKLPLPPDTELVESISKAGKLVGNGNGMQYFGAILIKSELSPDEVMAFYQDDDCFVVGQLTPQIIATENALSFRHQNYDGLYYTVYRWGDAPDWLRDLLDTDLRGH